MKSNCSMDKGLLEGGREKDKIFANRVMCQIYKSCQVRIGKVKMKKIQVK